MAETEQHSAFISERVRQYQTWYDKKAVWAKKRFLFMRGFSVAGGSIVPVLINVPSDLSVFGGIPVIKTIVTLTSLLVVIAVSLESVFHYREQWKNYRSTEQFLGHETIAFTNGVGVYRDKVPQDAFGLFVERVEDAIRSENAATLNIMTLAQESANISHDVKR
jgi:Protein of unknown function (DUF4231)